MFGEFFASGVFFIIGLMVVFIRYETAEERIMNIIIAFIISILLGFSFTGIIKLERKQNLESWNNGICTNCGGEYYFTNSYKNVNSSQRYIYCCDQCGKVINLSYNFIKER